MEKKFLCLKCGHRWDKRRDRVPIRCASKSCRTAHWHDYDKYKAFECLRCGYKWESYLKRPPQCPNCHKKYYDDLLEHNNKGANNIRWNGGTSVYKDHYILKKNRLKVLIAANYTCQICGGKATMTHHLDGTKTNHTTENLLAVCCKCNMAVYHPNKAHKPFKFGTDLKVVASYIGCSYTTIGNHLSGRQLSTRFGDAINNAMKRIKNELKDDKVLSKNNAG